MPVFSRALPPEFSEFLAKGSVPKGSVVGLGQQAGRADLHHRGLGLQPRGWDGVGRASQVKGPHCPTRPGHPGRAQSPLHFPQELVSQNLSLCGVVVEGAGATTQPQRSPGRQLWTCPREGSELGRGRGTQGPSEGQRVPGPLPTYMRSGWVSASLNSSVLNGKTGLKTSPPGTGWRSKSPNHLAGLGGSGDSDLFAAISQEPGPT